MLEGRVPEKRLVLMWKKAKYLSSPNSSGNVPDILSWFKSMPETTKSVQLSGGAAHDTPLYWHTSKPTQVAVMLLGSEVMAAFHAWRAQKAAASSGFSWNAGAGAGAPAASSRRY